MSSPTSKNAAADHDLDLDLPEPKPSAGRSCPYHKDTLALKPPTGANTGAGKTPMERFLQEDASKQSATVGLADGKLSISKDCTCGESAKKTEMSKI